MHGPNETWIVILEASSKACRERALVLESRGVRSRVRSHAGRHVLEVPADRGPRAQAELQQWEAENQGWPPTDVAPSPPLNTQLLHGSVVLYVCVLLFFHGMLDRVGDVDLRALGMTDSGRVQDGEWWRCVTALCLHADAVHLAGNLVFGAWFGGLVVRQIGGGVGWLAIVGAGALGNLVNVSLRGEGFRSLGASTAVFAAVGILGALGWRHKQRSGFSRAKRWGPLIVGVWILSVIGTGGTRTDVLGHCWGLLAGVAAGVWVSRRPPMRDRRVQWAAGGLTLALLSGCWLLALR